MTDLGTVEVALVGFLVVGCAIGWVIAALKQ
jgi:hypothetical protein